MAGGAAGDALRLAASMTALQFAIGAANDVVDATGDSGREDKPIPSGAVSRRWAIVAVVGLAAAGLALAATSLPMVALGAVVLGIGLAYDLWAKGTALSWLPFGLSGCMRCRRPPA